VKTLTDNQKLWLENFLLNSNVLRYAMIEESKTNKDPEIRDMGLLVLSHNKDQLMDML
jgi:hypothetical protein